MIKKIIQALLICLFLSFSLFKTKQLFFQVENTRSIVKNEPKDKTFFTDEMKYLKNYYLMKKGLGYYQAHLQATKALAGEEDNTWKKDFWGWRLPFVFYFWKIFTKNGLGIFNLFTILSIFSFLSSYLITRKFVGPKIALLAPLVLFPYFLNALKSTSFLFIAWWGLFFFIFGLMFFYYKRFIPSALFFTFAVISREHFIIPLLFMFFISVFYKKNWAVFLIPIIFFFLIVSFHAYKVSSLINLESPFGFNQRLSYFSKNLLLATLSFSTNSYFLVDFRPSLVWPVFSVIGLGYLGYKAKSKYPIFIALSSFLAMFLSLPFMSNSIWEAYWGAMYVPLAAVFSPTVLKILDKKQNLEAVNN